MMDCSGFLLRWGLSTATRRTAAAAVRTAGTASAAAHGTAPAASPGTAAAAALGTAATAARGTATERRQLTSKWQGPLCPSVQATEEKDIERNYFSGYGNFSPGGVATAVLLPRTAVRDEYSTVLTENTPPRFANTRQICYLPPPHFSLSMYFSSVVQDYTYIIKSLLFWTKWVILM